MAPDRDPASAPPASTPSGSSSSSPSPATGGTKPDRGRGRRHKEQRDPDTMIPARSKRLGIESFLMRVVATVGIVAIGVAIAAIMVGQDVQGWIVGLVVSIVSVLLAGILWSSRRL
jgi:hypothetical protein